MELVRRTLQAPAIRSTPLVPMRHTFQLVLVRQTQRALERRSSPPARRSLLMRHTLQELE